MTRITYDPDGYPHPSKLDSMVVWKRKKELDKARKNGYRDKHGICIHCGGDAMLDLKGDGYTRCICWTLMSEQKLRRAQNLATPHEPLKWTDFEVWGNRTSKETLSHILDDARDWASKIDTWLMLVGKVGTGKSHLLNILDTYLSPWSLYISVPDLKDLVFHHTGEGDLDKIINVISKHPILILDDVGAEYASEYAVSATRQIVMARYTQWQEFPTIVSTNQTPGQFETYDLRMADRLFDQSKVRHLSFEGVASWRRRWHTE